MTVKGTDLDRSLAAAHAEARTLWPEIELPFDTYRAHVNQRVPPETSPEFGDPCLIDLYLACACARGQPEAIAVFEREHMPRVAAATGRITAGKSPADETKQVVREILFVGSQDRAPAIAEYSGRGALRSWVRVVAVREAMRLARRQGGKGVEVQVEEERLFDFFAPKSDPESSYIKDKAVADFRTALLETIAELPRRQRTVLRLSVLDGLSIDEIAPIYEVHRATVARWLERARDAIFQGTRQRLRKQLDLGNSEVDSLIRVARSRIDVTLGNALDTSD